MKTKSQEAPKGPIAEAEPETSDRKGAPPESGTKDEPTWSRMFDIHRLIEEFQISMEQFAGLACILAKHFDSTTNGDSTYVLACNVHSDIANELKAIEERVWELSGELRDKEGGALWARNTPSRNQWDR